MNNLYMEVNFPFADKVKIETLEITKNWNDGKIFYCRQFKLSSILMKEIDDYFMSRGLGATTGESTIFKRFNTTIDPLLCHYDLVGTPDNAVFNASFIFPAEGGKGGGQYWFEGENEIQRFEDEKGIYAKIKWLETPRFIESVEIDTIPMVVNIGIPHNAYSSREGYRTVSSFRLKSNPSFEEICRKLSE